ncbi:MAG: transcription elongation factor Spt5 [Thermoplasmata archaeon]
MGVFEPEEIEEEEKKKEEKPSLIGYGLHIEHDELQRIVPSGADTDYHIKLENTGDHNDTYALKLDLIFTEEEEGALEWSIRITGMGKDVWDVTLTGVTEKMIEVKKGDSRPIALKVVAPKNPKYGSRANIVLAVISRGDPAVSETITMVTSVRQSIMAVKTSIGHEKSVAKSIASRAKRQDSGIFSVLSPPTLRGYVLVESINPDALERIVKGIRRARGIVKGETTFKEIDHFLTPQPLVSGVMEGDIVELVAGPFKGEKARVQHIDESKEEITVELFESMVPIPVTVRGDHVRVLEKEEG